MTNRPPDHDPPRGPRRYGPNSAADSAGGPDARRGRPVDQFGVNPEGPVPRGGDPLIPSQSEPPWVPREPLPRPVPPSGRPLPPSTPPTRSPIGPPGRAWSEYSDRSTADRSTADRITSDRSTADRSRSDRNPADRSADRTVLYPPGGLPGGPAGGPGPRPPDQRSTGARPPRTQGQRNRGGRPADYQPGGPRPASPDVNRSRRPSGLIIAGRIVAALLSIAVLTGFAFAWGLASKATNDVATGNDTSKAGQAGVLFRGGENVLLIGSDARTDQQGNPLSAAELAAVSTQADGGGVNTDTIMVVHIPQGGGKATAVSLPRDTWIPQSVTDIVNGPYSDGTQGPYKANKINSFYSTASAYTQEYDVSKGVSNAAQRQRDADNAGRTELQAIVQAFTGLHIDHYAEVNLIGFYTLSNAIGGVPVCLKAAVSDPFSGANFKAGPQEISGSAAMSFVRQRHGLPNGDLDRVRRQQAFLAGATSRMLSAGVLTSPSKMSSLITAASRALVLDSGFDLLTFAGQMADLSGGNVTFETMPTNGSEASTAVDALATDPAQIKAFFAAINGKTTPAPTSSAATIAPRGTTAALDPASITVDVQNAAKINNLAASVSATLVAAGYKAGDVTTYPGITDATAHTKTTISYPTGGKAAAAAVQKALGGKGILMSDDSIAAGHISVAAGKDLPAPTGLRAPALRDLAAGAVAATGVAPGAAPITAASIGCVN